MPQEVGLDPPNVPPEEVKVASNSPSPESAKDNFDEEERPSNRENTTRTASITESSSDMSSDQSSRQQPGSDPKGGGATDGNDSNTDLAADIRKTAILLQSNKTSVRSSSNHASLTASAAAVGAVTNAKLNNASATSSSDVVNDNRGRGELGGTTSARVVIEEVDVDDIDVDETNANDISDHDVAEEHHIVTHTAPTKHDVKSADSPSDEELTDDDDALAGVSVPEFAIRDAIDFYFSDDYANALALARAKEQQRQKGSSPLAAAGAIAAAGTAAAVVAATSSHHDESGTAVESTSMAPQQPDYSAAAAGHEEEKTEECHDEVASTPRATVVAFESAAPPEQVPVEEMDTPAINKKRAEFIRVTVFKKDASIPHGLSVIVMDGRDLRISAIDEDGLFADSSLKMYDKLLRVNKISCANLDPAGVLQILSVMTGKITLLAQNIGGDQLRAEVSIRKPFPDSRIGVSFREVQKGNAPQSNNPPKRFLEVSRVEEKSLFANTLVHPGDRVMAINDCVDLDMITAQLLMDTTPLHVHMTVKTKLDLRSVLAREQVKELPPGYDIVRATEDARRHERERQQKQGCYYIVCEQPGACGTMIQWTGNIYVLCVVVALVIIAWTGWRDNNYENSDALASILPFVAIFVGGGVLCFAVNAPWLFRQVGKRFSWSQLICNILLAGAFAAVYLLANTGAVPFVQDQEVVLYILLVPLAIFVNLPSIFVRIDDGSDGETITPSDIDNDEDLESNKSGANNKDAIATATVTAAPTAATTTTTTERSDLDQSHKSYKSNTEVDNRNVDEEV